jgi:hypothetical protein
MAFDYSQTADPRDFGEVIPHGTIATVQMRLRPGGVGEDGMLKRTAKGDAEMLECEFVVVDGPYVKRRFWDNFLLEGTTSGQQQMAETSRGRLKKILESARGIRTGDKSEQAQAAYRATLKDFDGIMFIGKISVEKGAPKNDGSGDKWQDRNRLGAAIGPDSKDWHPIEQPPPFDGGGAATTSTGTVSPESAAPAGSAPITPPAWAR